MATVSITVLKHQKKADGTWNVKIRVSHKGKDAYIDTPHFVIKNQLNTKGKLKDQFIIDRINPRLKDYRDTIGGMHGLDYFTAKEIRDKLLSNKDSNQIEFISFCKGHIERMNSAGKESSAKTLTTVLNNLLDFIGHGGILVSDITSRFLVDFEKYLRNPRKMIRNKVEYTKPGLSDSGLHNQMRDLRLLFNAAREHYNDEDRGITLISHYPFKKYKVGQAPETESRALTIEQIIAIRDSEQPEGSRPELARDLFMLSFYLCGMNAADMYSLKKGKVSRVNYNRTKTKGRRKDKAFISVKLIDEARELYDKYAGTLQLRYSSHTGLDAAINKGLEKIDPNIDFYAARHSFGDLARNTCRFSKDDVGLALNHKDRSNSTTDIYISKNWDIVDEVQEKVCTLLKIPVLKVVGGGLLAHG